MPKGSDGAANASPPLHLPGSGSSGRVEEGEGSTALPWGLRGAVGPPALPRRPAEGPPSFLCELPRDPQRRPRGDRTVSSAQHPREAPISNAAPHSDGTRCPGSAALSGLRITRRGVERNISAESGGRGAGCLPRAVTGVAVALGVVAPHTGQLPEISPFRALPNLSTASFRNCMHETCGKGTGAFRQKLSSYFSQRTREGIPVTGNPLCCSALTRSPPLPLGSGQVGATGAEAALQPRGGEAAEAQSSAGRFLRVRRP